VLRTETSDRAKGPDPAHRYRAIEAAAIRLRAEGQTYDMLEALVESVYGAEAARFELAEGEEPSSERDEENLAKVRAGVMAAIATYDGPASRALFDASLLAGASEEQLAECFNVDPLETAAYRHLFFDRNVFPNAFHLITYIASRPVEGGEQLLLRIAQSQGFDAIVAQYGLNQTLTPEAALQNVLHADAAAYQRYRELPITHQSTKDVRALGKQVVETAKAIQKVQESRTAAAERMRSRRDDEEFILVAAPANPTLRELLAAGGEIASPADTSLT